MAVEMPSPIPKISPDDDRHSDQRLSSCILMLFESQILTDVTFRCKDQDIEDPTERIHAHKNILAARSPVFRAMFSGSYEDGGNDIHLSDIKSEDFKIFLRSIYSDELPSEVDNLVQTLKIAHKYQINYVVNTCFSQLSGELIPENACSLLDLALFYGNEELTTSASRYIDANSGDILETEGFLEISLQCLTFILKGDTFFTNETQIFERSMQWAEKKCNSTEGAILRSTLAEAFFYLRTPAMTLKEFIGCTKRRGYYTMQETEDLMEAIASNFDEECNNTLSNYRTSRVPPQINIKLLEGQYKASTYVSQATTCLKLKPAIDMILTSIQLSDLHNGGMYQYNGYNSSYQTYDADGRQMKATVKIGEIGIFQEYIITAQKNPLCIQLNSPILLKCTEDGYCLKIELSPINITFIALGVDGANSYKDFIDVSKTITVRYDSSSTCHTIVDSLTFQHLSHRDN